MNGHISNDLTIEEMNMLAAAGENPADYVALMQPIDGMGIAGIGKDPRGDKLVVFALQLGVPMAVLPIRTGMLDANGQPRIVGRGPEGKLFGPVPPLVRMTVHRSALSDEQQARLTAAQEAQTAAVPPTTEVLQPPPFADRIPLPRLHMLAPESTSTEDKS